MTVASDDSRTTTVTYALFFTCATLTLLLSLRWHMSLRQAKTHNEVRDFLNLRDTYAYCQVGQQRSNRRSSSKSGVLLCGYISGDRVLSRMRRGLDPQTGAEREQFPMTLFIFQQVSKRMATMSRLRAVWESLAVKNASMLLKKRVDVCTDQELENAVVQHRKARTDVLSATHCIKKGTISIGDYRPSTVVLAPGGRWLLNLPLAFKFGVVYIDIDDPNPS